MANIPITTGTGAASVAGETVSGITYQQIEVYGGGGASVLGVNPDGSIKASIIGTPTVTFSGSPSISGAVTIVGTPTVNVSGTPSISGAVTIVGTPNVNVTNTPSISGTVNVGGTVALSPSIFGSSIIGAPPANLFVGGALVTTSNAVPIQPPASGVLPVVIPGSVLTVEAPVASIVSGVTSVITGTASVLVLAAAAGAQRNYITQILITNGAATGTFVDVVDNGSVIYSGYCAASGGGFSAFFDPPLRQPTSVLAVYVAPRAQASIIAAMSGYTGA